MDLENGADIRQSTPNLDAQDNVGNTTLHFAIKSRRENCFETILRLLDAGARSDIKNNDGRTFFFYYVTNYVNGLLRFNEAIFSKINNYIDIDDFECRSVAHIAVKGNCNRNFLQFVVEKQKNLNVEDIYDNTPLNYLTELLDELPEPGIEYEKRIRLLVDHGAYLKADDCQRLVEKQFLRQKVLADAEFCTQSVVNEFNNNLAILYNLPLVVSLPPMEKLKLKPSQVRVIKQFIEAEIFTRGHCDISKMPLMFLSQIIARYISQNLGRFTRERLAEDKLV